MVLHSLSAQNSNARKPRSSSAPRSTSSKSRSIPSRPISSATVPFLEAAWQGQFDGALLQLERAFMPTYGDTSPGTVILFAGRVSDIDCTRTGIDIKCRSHLEILNIQMPRRLWQSSCTHIFGDAMCQFDRSGLQTIVSCRTWLDPDANRHRSRPESSKRYTCQGTIIGVGGANAGRAARSRHVGHGVVYCEAGHIFRQSRWATSSNCSPVATARFADLHKRVQ